MDITIPLPPTLQELQQAFEKIYSCKFKFHQKPELGHICVTSGGTISNLNSEWFQYVKDEAENYNDTFANISIPSDTNCTRIEAWNMMYSNFYNSFIRSMPQRRAELRRLYEEEQFRKEQEAAETWASQCNERSGRYLINDYRRYNKKTDKIFRIIKQYSSYSSEEVEAILHYLDPYCVLKYKKNTLLAMKAFNRFAKENEIDVTSAIVVWKDASE